MSISPRMAWTTERLKKAMARALFTSFGYHSVWLNRECWLSLAEKNQQIRHHIITRFEEKIQFKLTRIKIGQIDGVTGGLSRRKGDVCVRLDPGVNTQVLDRLVQLVRVEQRLCKICMSQIPRFRRFNW
jgi:hypothetical protein